MCPGIDAIDADTFQYNFTNKTMVGYFDWNLDFKWHAKNDFSWEIYDMPAMSGGLFAIHKKFFETLGFYDPGKFPAPQSTKYIHQISLPRNFKSLPFLIYLTSTMKLTPYPSILNQV